MDTDQVHIQYAQRNDVKLGQSGAYKPQTTRLCLSAFVQSGASIYPYVLPVYAHPANMWSSISCAVGATNCICRSKSTCLVILHNNSIQHRESYLPLDKRGLQLTLALPNASLLYTPSKIKRKHTCFPMLFYIISIFWNTRVIIYLTIP